MQNKNISPSLANPSSLLRKTVALVTTVALAAMVLMFSAMLLVVVLFVVVFGGSYLWWKTRGLRKQMKSFRPSPHDATMRSDAGEAFKGEVIEGEAIRMDERRVAVTR